MARPLSDADLVRDQLLEHLEALVRRNGAVSLTLAELAASAGMSTANIYRYFENKQALLEAAAERWFAPKIRIMEQVVESDLPARQKLYEFFARRFVMMRENYRAEPALFVAYLDLGDEHVDLVRGYIDLGDHYLAMIIAEAMHEGSFAGLNVDRTVSLINLAMQPFCNPRMMVDLIHSVSEEKLGQLVDALIDGLAAVPAKAESRHGLLRAV